LIQTIMLTCGQTISFPSCVKNPPHKECRKNKTQLNNLMVATVWLPHLYKLIFQQKISHITQFYQLTAHNSGVARGEVWGVQPPHWKMSKKFQKMKL